MAAILKYTSTYPVETPINLTQSHGERTKSFLTQSRGERTKHLAFVKTYQNPSYLIVSLLNNIKIFYLCIHGLLSDPQTQHNIRK